MPSHAIPRGSAGQALRLASRKWRWRSAMPGLIVVLTAVQVAGRGESRGSVTGQVLGLFRLAAGVVAVAVVAALVLIVVMLGVRQVSAGRSGPAPRWQYLASGAVLVGLAAAVILLGWHEGNGSTWPSRACFAAGEWCGLAGLVLLGRAVRRGWIRHGQA